MSVSGTYTQFTPNLGPSINQNPKPIVKLGHAVFSEVDGLDKVFKCAKSAIDFISALTPSIPAYLPILGSLVKGAGEVIMPFQFFKVAKEWTEINKKTWAGKASLAGITAVTAISAGRFLEKIQLFNMTAAVSKLGNVPVLGTIVQLPFGLLTASISAFSAVDAGMKLRNETKTFGKADVARTKLQKWTQRQQAVVAYNKDCFASESATIGFEAIPNWNATSLGAGYSKKNHEERTKRIAEKTQFLLNSHPTVGADNPDAMNAVHAYTAYKVRYWRAELDNSKVESKKAIFTLANEISKFALIVLGMVGVAFSIAALAVSSVPMLTFGLIVASIAIAKKVYDTNHKERLVMSHPDRFEGAVLAKYRELKKTSAAAAA